MPPGIAVVRQVRADNDRGDQIARKEAQQEKAQGEAEPGSRRLQLAHPLRRLRLLPAVKHVGDRDEEQADDHVVERVRLRVAAVAAAARDSLGDEVGDRDHGEQRDGRAEDVGGRNRPPPIAGREEEGADDLRARRSSRRPAAGWRLRSRLGRCPRGRVPPRHHTRSMSRNVAPAHFVAGAGTTCPCGRPTEAPE